jgi:hypothetical protein
MPIVTDLPFPLTGAFGSIVNELSWMVCATLICGTKKPDAQHRSQQAGSEHFAVNHWEGNLRGWLLWKPNYGNRCDFGERVELSPDLRSG